MAADERLVRETWAALKQLKLDEQGRIIGEQLRNEWSERARMARAEREQRRVDAALRDAAARRSERCEQELMSCEHWLSERERLTEKEGRRAMLFIWPPDTVALFSQLINVQQQAMFRVNVQTLASWLGIPVLFPLPIHSVGSNGRTDSAAPPADSSLLLPSQPEVPPAAPPVDTRSKAIDVEHKVSEDAAKPTKNERGGAKGRKVSKTSNVDKWRANAPSAVLKGLDRFKRLRRAEEQASRELAEKRKVLAPPLQARRKALFDIDDAPALAQLQNWGRRLRERRKSAGAPTFDLADDFLISLQSGVEPGEHDSSASQAIAGPDSSLAADVTAVVDDILLRVVNAVESGQPYTVGDASNDTRIVVADVLERCIYTLEEGKGMNVDEARIENGEPTGGEQDDAKDQDNELAHEDEDPEFDLSDLVQPACMRSLPFAQFGCASLHAVALCFF